MRNAKVAELVDALDSGSSEQCARGGSSPPFRTTPDLIDLDESGLDVPAQHPQTVSRFSAFRAGLRTAAMLGWVVFALGCSKSPADVLVEESFVHLEAAAEMLERHAGDTQALVIAVMHYRVAHRDDFVRLREQGEKRIAELSDADRRAFYGRHRSRFASLSGRIEALVKRYPDERLALRTVRPLMIVASPRGGPTGGEPPWLPPVPPPPGVTATGP
ncbi:MAG: hypothetical protein RIT45_2670 [Pseudomonadota bacterium]